MRFRQAVLRRRLQVLDRELSAASSAPCAIALVGRGGQTEVFVTGLAETFDSPRPLQADLQHLLAAGRFHDGALLVLGRDRPRVLPKPQAHYPQLLVELRETADAGARVDLCNLGLSGLRHDRSAASALLWWERARLNAEARPAAAVIDFAEAALDFQAAAVPERARAARRWARRLERARQLDLFAPAARPGAPGARYDVTPALLSETSWAGEVRPHTAPALLGPWRPLGVLQLEVGAIDLADLREAPVSVSAMAVDVRDDGVFEVSFSPDLAPRATLGLPQNPEVRLRCALSSTDCEVSPGVQQVAAGGIARFQVRDLCSRTASLSLTVLAESGQSSQLKVDLIASPRGGNAIIRARDQGSSKAA